MGSCNCTGPPGRCHCSSGTGLRYDTKVVEARRPAHKPAAPEDRLSAFSLPELDEIMRERGIVGTGKRFKADKVQLIADDLDGDTEALIEYEFRYGRSGD